jgi:hypothetical protein
MPTAAPTRPIPPLPAGCSGSGSGNGFSCSQSMICSDGSHFEIHCKQNADGTSSCSCGGTGAFFILSNSVDNACRDGILNCPH